MAVPTYTLAQLDGDGAVVVRLVIDLPLVASMAEVDVELTTNSVTVSSTVHAELNVQLPMDVDPDSDGVRAKFSKKSRTLRIDLPVATAQPKRRRACPRNGTRRSRRAPVYGKWGHTNTTAG